MEKISNERLNNVFFDIYGDYLSCCNQEQLYKFICKHLIDNNEFLTMVSDTIASKNFILLTNDERKDEFRYFLHNGHRSFILNVIILKYLSDEFTKNSSQFLDEFWQEKFNKLQNILK